MPSSRPSSSISTAREHAEAIWRAGVAAVDSQRLVQAAIRLTEGQLAVGGLMIPLARLKRIEVVGAGKAGAGMARGAETALANLSPVAGWVNVPAGCVATLPRIHLHAARPAGRNEPTVEGVAGSEEILRRVATLGTGDLCLVLISGGGSALLPAPVEGVPLTDKLDLIRRMSLAGASIHELNQVRRALSRIKGGGLARACRAEWIVTLIISDVIGDPLETIASGPTILCPPDPQGALTSLRKFLGGDAAIPESVRRHLERPVHSESQPPPPSNHHAVQVIGNNMTAVQAARQAAIDLGYDVEILGTDQAGAAADVGRELAAECLRRQSALRERPLCLLSGGEPVVHVTPHAGPQKGGRNQELALAALQVLGEAPAHGRGITILSGGTDGEDGPTDAAGAVADTTLYATAAAQGLSLPDYLAQHNSYEFFDRIDGLLRTGPTHTNVMDLRVALIDSSEA